MKPQQRVNSGVVHQGRGSNVSSDSSSLRNNEAGAEESPARGNIASGIFIGDVILVFRYAEVVARAAHSIR